MDKQQFATIAIGIKSAYPASKILEDGASMDFWYMMLNDIPYEVAENAVMEHICTSVYPPNIAEIRKLCMERCRQPVLSFDDAWGVVQKAMSMYGSWRTEEAYRTMDALTLSVVKNIGWTRMCQSENPVADRANFREAYEAKAQKLQSSNCLPEFVVQNKALLKERYIPAIEEKGAPEIEQKESDQDVRDGLTDEQLADRARRFDEIRRRILGGESKEK